VQQGAIEGAGLVIHGLTAVDCIIKEPRVLDNLPKLSHIWAAGDLSLQPLRRQHNRG
jgi:hypothetical protein